jgi:hypothetical protein
MILNPPNTIRLKPEFKHGDKVTVVSEGVFKGSYGVITENGIQLCIADLDNEEGPQWRYAYHFRPVADGNVIQWKYVQFFAPDLEIDIRD